MNERERKSPAETMPRAHAALLAGEGDDPKREQQLELIAAAVTKGIVEARELPSSEREAKRLEDVIHQLRNLRRENDEQHRQLMIWGVAPFLAALLIFTLYLGGWCHR